MVKGSTDMFLFDPVVDDRENQGTPRMEPVLDEGDGQWVQEFGFYEISRPHLLWRGNHSISGDVQHMSSIFLFSSQE